jgi:plasmid stabilization system protein ParE
MKSGYRVDWTAKAKSELSETFDYIEKNWTRKELRKLALELETTEELISLNPLLFQETEETDIRRAVVMQLNSIFYHVNQADRIITVLSFFSNRKDPLSRGDLTP